MALRLARAADFRQAHHIAFYLANDGELDPHHLMNQALAMGKNCYLPVLKTPSGAMEFARYTPGDKLTPNRFGIPEPLPRAERCQAQQLDLVCMPLVGFDAQGNRLGMGGGFYDRTFAYKLNTSARKPRLIGLAHECQRVNRLPAQEWDVPLDAIVTDTRLYKTAGVAPRKLGKLT